MNKKIEKKAVSLSLGGKTNYLHKIYLMVSVVLGLILAIGMPLFNEPDGQYHYVISSNLSGLSNDLSVYGEREIGSGIDCQVTAYQQGNYFKTYYLTKIKTMPMSKQPRAATIPNITTFDFWGHIVPAIGLWIGNKIYPSIGVMVVTARIISVFIDALLMFFIIKFVKKGKLIFAALSLSPVILNSFASLSYDSLSFILVAWLMAIVINSLVDQQIRRWRWVELVVASVAIYVGSKTNFKLLLLWLPFLIVRYGFPNIYNWTCQRFETIWRNKKQRIALILGILVVTGSVAIYLLMSHTGLLYSIYRVFINYAVNLKAYLTPGSVFYNLLGSPYPTINYTPAWVAMLWFIVLLMTLLSEDKFVTSKLIPVIGGVLFLLGVAAVYYAYMTYTLTGSPVGNAIVIGQMQGLQGRYFTPTIFLLLFVTCYDKFKLKISGQKWVIRLVMGTAILTNILLLFSTLFGIYYL